MRAEDIPEEERTYIVPGNSEIFEHGGKYYMYMGKFAGWIEHDEFHITRDGNYAGVIGKVDVEAARAAAERIVMTALAGRRKH